LTALAKTNLLLKFLLELAALAAFAYWGGTVGDGAVSVLVAIAAPVPPALLWATFAAPRSARRLPRASRIPLEMGVFAVAAVALLAAGAAAAAAILAALVCGNSILLTVFDQWGQ
jgi:hypothetical protein